MDPGAYVWHASIYRLLEGCCTTLEGEEEVQGKAISTDKAVMVQVSQTVQLQGMGYSLAGRVLAQNVKALCSIPGPPKTKTMKMTQTNPLNLYVNKKQIETMHLS